MTIEESKYYVKLNFDGMMENPQVILDPKYIEAEKIAIKSLDAWEKMRAELSEYGSICVLYTIKGTTPKDIEDIVDDVVERAKKQMLDIIDKHMREVMQDA